MARNDDQQRGSDTPPRVYKSSDVHRRRVDRKGRAKESAGQASPSATDEGAIAQGQSETEAKPAVVISPEFGKRTDAQRQSDDRWFAAMRESDLSEPTPNVGVPAVSKAPVAEPTESDASVPVEAPTSDDTVEPAPSAPDVVATAAPATPATQEDGTPPASDDEVPDAAPSPKRPSALRRLLDYLPKKRSLRIVAIVIPIVIIVAIAAALLFAWNRWYRFDDHVDMQGTWYVAGTEVPIEIDETSIKLTDDVTYQYEIETHDKTITYTFGPMEGQGRYWFSDDRQYLVITDGSDFDGTSTALDDLLHSLSDMGDKVTGAGMKLPEGEGIVAFCRRPDKGPLPSRVAEAVAAKKAEEEERREAERRAAEEAAEAEYYDYYYYYEEDYTEESASEGQSSDGESQGEPTGEEYYGEEG